MGPISGMLGGYPGPRYAKLYTPPLVVGVMCRKGNHRSVAFPTIVQMFASGNIKVINAGEAWQQQMVGRSHICAMRHCPEFMEEKQTEGGHSSTVLPLSRSSAPPRRGSNLPAPGDLIQALLCTSGGFSRLELLKAGVGW